MSEQYKQAYERIVEEYLSQVAAATVEFEQILQEKTDELKKLGVKLAVEPEERPPLSRKNGGGPKVFD